LIDGAQLPQTNDWPAELRPLALLRPLQLRNSHFDQDADALAREVGRFLSSGRLVAKRWPVVLSAVAFLVFVGGFALYEISVMLPIPWASRDAKPPPSANQSANSDVDAQKSEEAARQRRASALTEPGQQGRTSAEVDKEEERRKAEDVQPKATPAIAPGTTPHQSFRDQLADGQPCAGCPEMVVVPSGGFIMGSPKYEELRAANEDQIKVVIARPFAVGKYPVTFQEWEACLADGGCGGHVPDDRTWGRGRRPAINVSWNDVKAYIVWLSKKTGKAYRLLSEAEREYVTRAATTTPFWWGPASLENKANYDSTFVYGKGTSGEYRAKTLPVDSFEPNPFGLHQVHGNVWDWTEDCWNGTNAGNPGNGSARRNGDCSLRVVRGGSWIDLPQHIRAASRDVGLSITRSGNIGFRVARALDP
jgi:formylglycine-generating enzyme required for sulfatase activity